MASLTNIRAILTKASGLFLLINTINNNVPHPGPPPGGREALQIIKSLPWGRFRGVLIDKNNK
jgi:hypothetical protein